MGQDNQPNSGHSHRTHCGVPTRDRRACRLPLFPWICDLWQCGILVRASLIVPRSPPRGSSTWEVTEVPFSKRKVLRLLLQKKNLNIYLLFTQLLTVQIKFCYKATLEGLGYGWKSDCLDRDGNDWRNRTMLTCEWNPRHFIIVFIF